MLWVFTTPYIVKFWSTLLLVEWIIFSHFQIYAWLKYLVRQHPKRVTLINIGLTYEKREILGVKISFKNVSQKAVFIESNIHAREWWANNCFVRWVIVRHTYYRQELLHTLCNWVEQTSILEHFTFRIVEHAINFSKNIRTQNWFCGIHNYSIFLEF